MILKLEGLYEGNHPYDNFVSFRIGKNQKKFFTFSQKDDYGYMIFGLFKYFVDIFFG